MYNESTQRAQTPPRLKCQPKVIRDSTPDFQINPDTNPDVCWIAAIALSASLMSPSFVKIDG